MMAKRISRKEIRKAAEMLGQTGGRPRKSLEELAVTGGYDRNPQRLLRRLGLSSTGRLPIIATPDDPTDAAGWKAFLDKLDRAGVKEFASATTKQRLSAAKLRMWDKFFTSSWTRSC